MWPGHRMGSIQGAKAFEEGPRVSRMPILHVALVRFACNVFFSSELKDLSYNGAVYMHEHAK